MNKNRRKKLGAILVSSLLTVLFTWNVFGADLNTLLSETEGLEEYLQQLTTDMQTLNLEYEYIQTEIDDVETRINSNEILLDDAQTACDAQYDLMKKRIVYLYESGDTNYLTALLSSDNLSDILNKFDYINNIVGYDRDMLDKYNDLVDTVTTLQADLIAKKAELEDLRTKAIDNMYKAAARTEASEEEIAEYGISAEEANDVIQEYISENGDAILQQLQQSLALVQADYPDYDILDNYDSLMQVVMSDTDLLDYDWSSLYSDDTYDTTVSADTVIEDVPVPTAAVTDDTAALAEQLSAQTGLENLSYDDLYMIAALVSGEVGYTDYENQKYMAYVVLNRMKSDIYPDTAYDVLHQSGQFNYWDAEGNEIRSDTYFIDNGPMETALQATQEAMNEDYSYYEDFPYMGAVTEQFYYDNPWYFTDTYGEFYGGNYYFNANWW